MYAATDFGLWWFASLFLPLLFIAVVALLLYWIVRRAVRDGIADARRRQDPGASLPGSQPPGPQSPGPQSPDVTES